MTDTTRHVTLEDAVAEAFAWDAYTYPTITKVHGGYTVTPGLAVDLPNCDIVVMWTYDGGAEVGDAVRDYSRVLDPCESLVTLGHLTYQMPEAVEAMEAGKAVTLTWAVVDAYCDVDECHEDHAVGHMWLASWED